MTVQNTKPGDQEKGGEKMINRSISIELSLWEQAKRKAGFAPVSAIIRALLRKWIRGEIEVDPEETKD